MCVSEDEVTIQVHVPPNLDEPSLAHETEVTDEERIPSITVKIALKAKAHLNDVRVHVHPTVPLGVNESLIHFATLEPAHPGETQVTFYMKVPLLPAELKADVTATYQSASGAPRVVSAIIRLPSKLVLRSAPPVKAANYKITIDTNKPPVSLNDIFPDLLGDNAGGAGNALGFKYFGMEPVITLLASKTSQRYRLQCDEFAFMWLMMNELINRLNGYFKKGTRGSDFRVSFEGPLPLQEYFDVLDHHFEFRSKDDNLRKLLEERAAQFRAIQRRLLTRFKDKTPAPLANLDTLLDGTYRQMLALADASEENRRQQMAAATSLSCATHILNVLMKLWQDMSSQEFAVLEASITPVVEDSADQGWEERADAAITHLLRTCLAKSAKDQAVNPTPLGLMKDTTKLKKHIALMCDRLSKGAKLAVDGAPAAPKERTHNPASSRKPPKGSHMGDSSSSSSSSLTDTGLPMASKFAGKKSPRSKKAKDLPPLNGELAPPSGGMGNKYVKQKSNAEEIPDLDALETPDTDSLLNGGDGELVYGL